MTEALHIVCPHCHTTNRVKTADLANAPDCGSCHQPLFTGQPLALDEAGFDRHIGRSQIAVLVDFWAPWCGPCRMIAPIMEKLSGQYSGKIKFCKINVDQNMASAQRYGAMSIPLLVFFKDGKEVGRSVGALPEPELRSKIDAALG